MHTSKTLARAGTAVAAIAGAALFLAPAWAQSPPEPYRYGYGREHMMWWGDYSMVFGPLIMIVVLAAAIAVVVLLVRWLAGAWHGAAPHGPPPGRTALDILKERFARGEIEKQEFEERRRLLRD